MEVDLIGFKEARELLRAVDKRLVRDFNAELRKIAEPARAEAARLAPRSGRNRAGKMSVNKRIGRTSLVTRGTIRNQHVGDTLKIRATGSKVVIYSNRTGSGIINYGGRHPLFGDRDHWYEQPATHFLERGVKKHAAQIERDIRRFVDDLTDRL